MRRKNEFTALMIGLAAVSMMTLSACKSSNKSTPGASSLSMMVHFTAAKVAYDTVALTSAKVLIKEIEFKNEAFEDSSELEIGPFVVDLNLSGGLTEIATGDLPNGTYDNLEFEIHKAEDGEAVSDTAFYNGPGDDQRFSFIITGTYNDTPFTYKSKKGVEQESTLNPPIVISDSLRSVNVTLIVNPSDWFKKNGVFLDPRNESNRSDIDDNIKNSFRRAVEDDDHDGHDDHEEDHE